MTRCLNDPLPTSICVPGLSTAGGGAPPSRHSRMTLLRATYRGPSPTVTTPSPSRLSHRHSPMLPFGRDLRLDEAPMTPEEARARTVAIISDALELVKKNEDLFH